MEKELSKIQIIPTTKKRLANNDLKRKLKDKNKLKQDAAEQVGKLQEGQQLQQFDHKKIKLDSFIIVIGKRRYGKSTWTQFILSKLWKFFPDGGYVFT